MSPDYAHLTTYQTPFGSPVPEISGKSGRSLGTAVLPARGQTTLKLMGETLVAVTTNASGVVTDAIETQLWDIEFVEIRQGRPWFLLILGILTLPLWLIGAVFIALFFAFQTDWIIVHTRNGKLILSNDGAPQTKEFCRDLLVLAKQPETWPASYVAQPQAISKVG